MSHHRHHTHFGEIDPPDVAQATPQRGPETARQPLARTGERVESYERMETDRFGRQYTVRVTIRTVPMSRRIKRQLQRLSE